MWLWGNELGGIANQRCSLFIFTGLVFLHFYGCLDTANLSHSGVLWGTPGSDWKPTAGYGISKTLVYKQALGKQKPMAAGWITSSGSAVPFNSVFKRIVQVISNSHSFLLAVHKRWEMGFKASLPRHCQCRILLLGHEGASLGSPRGCAAFRAPCRSQGSLAGPAPQPRCFSCHPLPQSRILLRSYPALGSLGRCLTAVWEQQWAVPEQLCTKINSGKQAPVGIAGFQLQEVQKVQSRTKGKIQLVSVGAESGPSWGKGISGNSLQRDVCTGKQSCFTGNLTHALEPVRSERPNKTRICWFFFFLLGCWVVFLPPYSHPPHCKN